MKIEMFAVVVATLLLCPLSRAELKIGDPFPSLASAELVGDVPDISGHVAIVDFWASWCAPCKASFPIYAQIQAEYAPRGLMFVAVSVDEKKTAYEGFLKKQRPPFVTLLDANKKLVSAVQVPSMPTSYVLDRTGHVRFVHVGFHGATTEKEIKAQVESLLAEGKKE